ncbi:acyltransferase family protein [Pedobacter sp. HMF7647]|uniref:Acyltransferase family protein n=1 Tax=Hufsiella arboris TaxID=2695275 RepID=A0A7K1YCB0_9SPHI|nr:acyltransferase [Hufsiella arboris]MXV51729.1 acyltransferase family protein [Hufsiella arboris]
MKQLPNLNPLRLFLAVVVVLFHVPLLSKSLNIPFYNDLVIFQRGTEAVKFFFTLSGFLIIKLLYNEKTETNTVNLKEFYSRRALRIFPAYYLVILTGIIVYHFLLPTVGINFNIKYNLFQLAAYYVVFLPNIFNIIYDPGAIFLVLWSIGIEEQFYLIIPLLIKTIRSKYLILVLCSILVVYLIIYVNSDLLMRFDLMYFYLLFGGVVSILYKKLSFLKISFIKYTLILIFLLLFFTNLQDHLNRFALEACTMIISGLFITMIAYYPPIVIKNQLINYLGQISYGIYMYHYIVLYGVLFAYLKILKQLNLTPSVSIFYTTVTTLFLTIICAHLSYKYFESFFLKKKRRNWQNIK